MLEKIKMLLGLASTDTTKDELLTYLLQMAQDEAINYCHTDDIYGLENCISAMVIFTYNNLGSENLNSESYSGVNYSYRKGYPDSIMRQLNSHRLVRFR